MSKILGVKGPIVGYMRRLDLGILAFDFLIIQKSSDQFLPIVKHSFLSLVCLFLGFLLNFSIPSVHQDLLKFLAHHKPIEDGMASSSTKLPTHHCWGAVNVELLGSLVQSFQKTITMLMMNPSELVFLMHFCIKEVSVSVTY